MASLLVARERMDAVYGPFLLPGALAPERFAPMDYYSDSVHPSPVAHALLGQAMARLISTRVAACVRAAADNTSYMPRTNEAEASSPHEVGHSPSVAAQSGSEHGAAPPAREWCFTSANELPVLGSLAAATSIGMDSSGFTLVDEGAAKRVQKLGLLSRKVGDVLRLGLPPSVHCGFFTVRLGHLQSWRPAQGAYRVRCGPGCVCSHEPGRWNDQAFPFPNVQTSTRRLAITNSGIRLPGAGCQDNGHCEAANVSVTVQTQFVLFKPFAESKCEIVVEHITIPSCARKSQRETLERTRTSHLKARSRAPRRAHLETMSRRPPTIYRPASLRCTRFVSCHPVQV